MSADCLFCKIIAGEIPSQKVFENDLVVGFKDLHPQAKEHFLFIHKRHTTNFNDLLETDPSQLNDLSLAMTTFAKEKGFDQTGYRVVTNIGRDAGQTVFHTHFHLLAGEQLGHFGR